MAKTKPGKGGNIDLNDPQLYINRELSLLEFNRRVLAQATNPSVPLLERLRFLCISCSNLDEFFEIRFSGLRQQEVFGADQRGPDNLSPTEQIRRIATAAHELVDAQYRVLNEDLLPALALEGVRFLTSSHWNTKQAQWVKRYFSRELSPILSPIGLDPAHPFPQVLNKGLNFMVTLKGKDAFGRNSGRAVIQAPRSLPRIVHLPEELRQAPYDFVLLSSIIEAHATDLLPGMKATGCYAFRVTRNSDLFVDEEEVEDLLQALEGELPSRNFGSAVRMEVAAEMPQDIVSFLRAQYSLDEGDVYTCAGPVNLNRLVAVPGRVDRSELKYPSLQQRVPPSIAEANSPADVFAAVDRRDVLIHHPFDSFLSVVEFLRSAAKDPKVLSIRQTLYRTGADSVIVKALMEAAANGKEVLVVIELRARFDEEANIELATLLQDSGVQVVYGIVGYKTHAKMSLVIRREGKSLKRYVHLGTGNYHPKTTRLYTDYGLLTADAEIGEDVQKLFQQLTSMGRAGKLKKLLQAPFTLHSSLLDFIEGEIDAAAAGKPALIQAKMNSLIEPEIIRALYRASQAGVRVQLIVRGICSLRPGIAGVSDNIEVRSIIGRFLEHTRVFYFLNRGLYLASADWMGRNFFSRIETCFPVLDARVAKRIMAETFDNYLRDDMQAWQLNSDGSYVAPQLGKRGGHSAQQWLLEHRDFD
ncbi:MAG: polyphosphate kinase 1 [Pseudomonadota bacterium]